MTNIRVFYLKIFSFLEVKLSKYLNRCVLVMWSKWLDSCLQARWPRSWPYWFVLYSTWQIAKILTMLVALYSPWQIAEVLTTLCSTWQTAKAWPQPTVALYYTLQMIDILTMLEASRWQSGKYSRLQTTRSWVWILLEVQFSSWLYSASLHRAFHYHPSIISI